MILARACMFVQYRIQGHKYTKMSHRSYPSTSACSCCALSYSIAPSHPAVLLTGMFTVIAFTTSSALDRLALAMEAGGGHSSGRNRKVFNCHSPQYMSSFCGLGIGILTGKGKIPRSLELCIQGQKWV